MIEIKGTQYQVNALTPREQFHLMRRVLPLFASIDVKTMVVSGSTIMEQVFANMPELTKTLAHLSDEDVDSVLDICLCHVSQFNQSTNSYHPIYIKQGGGQPALRMFVNIDAPTELRLVAEVLKENLGGFFGSLSGGGASSLSANTEAQRTVQS